MRRPYDPRIGEEPELIGTVLHGRYEVMRKLGVGGMAAVYEGRRLGLHRRVAIKVLRPDLAEDPDNVLRFLREARAASVIEHENIVDIVDFGSVDSRPVYFVMEYLDGEDLKALLRRKRRLPWPMVRAIALQIIEALHAAHQAGIVHRDVKPANCFLLSDEPGRVRVKVLDFGIAKVVTEGGAITRAPTTTGGVIGTVAYMSPEQAFGRDLDARSDIYSLGVVLYELLTGNVPFRGQNPFMVLEAHIKTAPRPLRDIDPTISEAVEAIVVRCLAKDREHRFADMLALRAALLELDDEGCRRPSPPPEADTLEPPRRRVSSLTAVVLGSVVGVAAAIGITVTWAIDDEGTPNEHGSTVSEHADAPVHEAPSRIEEDAAPPVEPPPPAAAPPPHEPPAPIEAADPVASPAVTEPALPSVETRGARTPRRPSVRPSEPTKAEPAPATPPTSASTPSPDAAQREPGRTHHPDLIDPSFLLD